MSIKLSYRAVASFRSRFDDLVCDHLTLRRAVVAPVAVVIDPSRDEVAIRRRSR
jgi:hypothetical protein